MQVIRIPAQYHGDAPSVFLGGGAGGRDWRRTLIGLISDTTWVLLDPLTPPDFGDDGDALRRRTEWEFEHLGRATVKLFWFPADTPCMLSLFELGAWAKEDVPLVLGIEPGYQKRDELLLQMQLERPQLAIASTLHELAAHLKRYETAVTS